MKKIPNTIKGQPTRVIHIDDDPVFLRCVKDTLEQHNNIEVKSFSKAVDFLEALPHITPFDAVVVDYIIKDTTRVELLKKVSGYNSRIPVISFSGHDDPQYIRQLKETGIGLHLSKSLLSNLSSFVLNAVASAAGTQNIILDDEELILLQMCCRNMRRDEMAEKLFIGQDAVKKRKEKLADRLGIQNEKICFLDWAVRNGYYKP